MSPHRQVQLLLDIWTVMTVRPPFFNSREFSPWSSWFRSAFTVPVRRSLVVDLIKTIQSLLQMLHWSEPHWFQRPTGLIRLEGAMPEDPSS